MRLTNSTFSNFISGQCLEACILGGLFAVTMAIFSPLFFLSSSEVTVFFIPNSSGGGTPGSAGL